MVVNLSEQEFFSPQACGASPRFAVHEFFFINFCCA